MDDPGQVAKSDRGLLPRSARERVRRVVQLVAGVALAVALLGWGLPALTHSSWQAIAQHLSALPTSTALLGLGLLALGLYCYTFTLSASLPGLGHVQALIVNLCGSGVSNAIPGGGAAGAAAQYGIFRSWGFGHRSIGSSLVVTTTWNMLIRLLLPLVAIVWYILESDDQLPGVVVRAALFAGVAAAVISLAMAAVLLSPRAAHLIGHTLNALVAPLLRLLHREHGRDIEALATDVRARIIDVVRAGWFGLTFGVVAFLGIYGYLYGVCMHAFGVDLGPDKVLACYAFSRLLTLVPLTPGGIGTTEVGPAALMVALGANGPAAAAAVFLFAIYSHLLEIPFGALAGAAWAKTRGHYYRPRERPPEGQAEGG